MCIRDRRHGAVNRADHQNAAVHLRGARDHVLDVVGVPRACLLYTSDAADERSSVDLGGRRIIKKKKKTEHQLCHKIKRQQQKPSPSNSAEHHTNLYKK